MNPTLRSLGCATLLAALSSPLSANTPAGLETCRIPLVRNIEQAPVIDGKMVGSEWKYALTMTGLVTSEGALSQRQMQVSYITDGEYLYVGMSVPSVPEGTAPEIKQGINYDEPSYENLFKNDHVEVKFGPPNRTETGDFYLVADAAGNVFSQRIKGEFRPFVGPWEIRSSSDGKGWTYEMRMKLSEFGLQPAKDGDIWAINFNTVLQFPLTFIGLVAGPHKVTPATITADAAAVQFESLGDLPRGKLDLTVSVREYEGVVATPKEGAYDERKVESGGLKLAATGKAARVTAEILDESGKQVFAKSEVLALLPAQKILSKISHDFTPNAKNTLKLKVETAPSAKDFDADADPSKISVSYATSIPFLPFNEKEVTSWQERLEKGTVLGSWRITPAFFPYWEKAKVEANFFKGKIADAARKFRVRITSDQGFQAEKEVPVENGLLVISGPEKVVEIPIPGLPAGTYTTVADVIGEDGKVLATLEDKYVRKVFPWEHNTLGKSRGVIKPWTPMSVAGDDVLCWGRNYKLNAFGWPTQIISANKPILAAPVTISLKGENGKLITQEASGSLTFDEKAEDRVRWMGQGTLGGSIKTSITGLAEYDGFTWYEVTLTPESPLKVSSGRISIALPEEVAQLMHFQSCWARDNFSGAVPRGEGTVFRSLDTINYGRKGAFSPHVWLGNLTRGLSWFADSDQGWSSSPDKSAIEIVRKDGQVELVMNIISRPVTLEKPRTIRFGLMATPFKPAMPVKPLKDRYVNWLSLIDGKTVIQPFMYAAYPKDFNYALVDEHIPDRRLYFNKHEMGAALPERAVFDNEWGGMHPDPDYPGAPERFGPGIESRSINRSLTDSRIDMQVYYIAELAKKTKMPGTYWDITGIASGLPMVENGTAYVDEETGRIVPTFDILKSRELFKRVATMWQEIRGEPDYMEIHSTNHIAPPFYSFAYEWLNFEWLNTALKAKRPDGKLMDYIDLRPLDTFATEGVVTQFGCWIKPISSGARPEDPAEFRRIVRSASALGGLHNHLRGYQPTLTPREVSFIGYWDEESRIKTDQEKVKASLWQQGDTLEVIVVNLDDKSATTKIQLDADKLGIKSILTVEDITPESELEIYIDTLGRQGKAELAKKSKALLEQMRTSKPAATFSRSGKLLEITVPDLPSHDYRVLRVKVGQ
jgi:hypothetical protein